MFAYLCLFFIFKNKNRMYIQNKMSKIEDFCEISMRIVRAACFFHRMLIRSFDQL